MTPPGDLQSLISNLQNIDSNGSLRDAEIVLSYLNKLLSSKGGIAVLKQQNKHFETVLSLFFKIVFSDDKVSSERCFENSLVIMDIFRSKLPKIKKQEWWKKFELDFMVKFIPKLNDRIEVLDASWVDVWSFIANLIITDSALSTVPLNTLLSISEIAFKKGKEDPEVLAQAWKCWIALIDTFGRSPNVLLPAKTLNLLMKPLQACHTVSTWRIKAWIRLIKVKGSTASDDTLKHLVDTLCKAMYKTPGDKAMCRHLPDDCAQAILDLIAFERVVSVSRDDIVALFEPCVNSQPSTALLENITTALLGTINNCNDESNSYDLWCTLLQQFLNCGERQVPNQVWKIFFTSDKFQLWITSDSTQEQDINNLMWNPDFRSQVLFQAITSHKSPEDESTPVKKKPKKAYDTVWSKYCEVYTAWWSTQGPAAPREINGNCEEESHDYKALLALMIHPIQSYTWNPSIFKSWTLIVDVCHSQKFLRSMSRTIFDTLIDQNVQKSVDVLTYLCHLDNSLCKLAQGNFDKLCSKVNLMDVKQIMDLLKTLEAAVNFKEMSSCVSKLVKSIQEKCSELDQLNAHKIKTKCGKVLQKLESLAPEVKTQRTPFRTQSNFLQRLAKAEEKNRIKSSYLSGYPEVEKSKDNVDVGDCNVLELSSTNDTIDDCLKVNTPPSAKSDPKSHQSNETSFESSIAPPLPNEMPQLNGNLIVAEKENVILPSSTTMKITNARDVKVVDSSSPSLTKKVKQLAGQKITPKKATPLKVSYFDDDASDCIMVPPKPKTTPLTEHQMEMMSKRRADIPALYQDLSQDTQLSNNLPSTVHEIVNGPVESEEIVLGTPNKASNEPTPELDIKNSSAKKLDFNLPNSGNHKPTIDQVQVLASKLEEEVTSNGDVQSIAHPNSQNDNVEMEDENSSVEESGLTNGLDVHDSQSTVEAQNSVNGGRRKRKSEPIKFSPKLTRSKKKVSHKADLSKLLPCEAKDSSESERLVPLTETSKNTKLPEATETPCNEPSSQCGLDSTAIPDETPTKLGRKRKNSDPPISEEPKKSKLSEDSNAISKKSSPRKKKKVNNLESWLVKTERVPECRSVMSVPESSVKMEEAPSDEPEKKLPFESVDLNNSEEIVPSTQELEPIHRPSTPLSGLLAPCVSSFNVDKEAGNVNDDDQEVSSKKDNNEVNSGKDNDAPVSSRHDNGKEVTSQNNNEEQRVENQDEGLESPQGFSPTANLSADNENEVSSTNSSPLSPKGGNEIALPEPALLESPDDDNVDLIITSPSKRQRRASSVMRGEGDTYLKGDSSQGSDGQLRVLRKRATFSSKKQRKQTLPTGRSARMLHLAASATAEGENVTMTTPLRKRENIVPLTLGENWPKGLVEDWVACTPISPYVSPIRSVLKKTPTINEEELKTPVRSHLDSLASPLLSSSRRKRVVFLDPPVTKGLVYERGPPYGSVHLADIPQGFPYPTWRSEDDPVDSKESPAKTSSEVSDRLAQSESPEDELELNRCKTSDTHSSSEDPPQVVDDTPTPESRLLTLKEKVDLDDSFLDTFSNLSPHLQHLILECFDSTNLNATIRAWTLENSLQVYELPHAFLKFVKNSNGESVTDAVKELILLFPVTPAVSYSTISVQTGISTCNAESQTVQRDVVNVDTNTISPLLIDGSSQADFPIPSEEELVGMLTTLGSRSALKYLSNALRLLAAD